MDVVGGGCHPDPPPGDDEMTMMKLRRPILALEEKSDFWPPHRHLCVWPPHIHLCVQHILLISLTFFFKDKIFEFWTILAPQKKISVASAPKFTLYHKRDKGVL